MRGTVKSNARVKTPDSLLTSRENRWLKRFRDALQGEEDADGMIAVEGLRMVEAALGSGLQVEALLVSESGEQRLARLGRSLLREIRILRTTDQLFAGVADTHS